MNILSSIIQREVEPWIRKVFREKIYDFAHSKILDSYQENYSYFEENIAQNE